MEKKVYYNYLEKHNNLRPNNLKALMIVSWSSILLMVSVFLMNNYYYLFNGVGVVILAINLLQWFVIMHECGHGTMFSNKTANLIVGYLSGFICGVPFLSWRRVHFAHHLWTGWKDKDPTTSQVVPREIPQIQKVILNTAWKLFIPLFVFMYRMNNFWHLSRLKTLYPQKIYKPMLMNALVYLVGYSCLVLVSPKTSLVLISLAFYLHLVISEPIMLSQHSHIPQKLALNQTKIKPHARWEQEQFTRSLIFPKFISKFILYNFEAHELHHMFPKIPGYYLNHIDMTLPNTIGWWAWLKEAHSLSAVNFLFKTRETTKVWI